MVGLTVKQIRKLAKTAYSDKQMIKRGGRSIYHTGKLWSNGEIALFETAPVADEKPLKGLKYIRVAQDFARWVTGCTLPVYPVEVLPVDGKINRAIAFENEAGARTLANARYIKTIMMSSGWGASRN